MPKYEREFSAKPDSGSKKLKIGVYLGVAFVIALAAVFVRYFYTFEGHHQEVQSIKQTQNRTDFETLLSLGRKRMDRKDYVGAYSDFQRALKLYPQDPKALELLSEAGHILCSGGLENYCPVNK